ncbi:MAG: pyruvate dehydrogenase (acetyl-transferring) E1 component subunit alpha [Candidatus Thorarchaeota archaeon]|nr:pyruvate dehydrogenase (acetyl-transferring) E1 component subunit alpha [Candidatus Thorarchaeota archaeon]
MKQILEPDGSVKADFELNISPEELIKWYKTMIAVRTLDEKGMRLQRQGRIGFHIPTTGQEAHVGAAAALKPSDWVFPAYREHGAAIYRGMPLSKIIDQYFGNEDDPQKGRRLPGLFGDPKYRFVNPSAPIGTQIIHAVGAAYAAKYRGDDEITVAFFGEGATSSNDFHSGMNFAGVFKTPSVLICQNNQYAISLPSERQTAADTIAQKAQAYGMPRVRVDGNDILAVYGAVREAAERARKGKGPTLIENVTYRLGPHTSSDDPSRYRSEKEVEKWKEKDPIERFKIYLIREGILTEEKDQNIREKYDTKIKRLIKEASSKKEASTDKMFTDVYADMPWHLEEQLNQLKSIEEEG